jgi:methionine synthase II (cobalamin-independent)
LSEIDEARERLRAALDHIDPRRLITLHQHGLGPLGRDLAEAN